MGRAGGAGQPRALPPRPRSPYREGLTHSVRAALTTQFEPRWRLSSSTFGCHMAWAGRCAVGSRLTQPCRTLEALRVTRTSYEQDWHVGAGKWPRVTPIEFVFAGIEQPL